MTSTYAVQYVYDDRSADRDAVRPEHRTFLRGLLEEGRLLASGPTAGPTVTTAPGSAASLADEPPGALLIVRAGSTDEAAELLDADPFWAAGLVARRSVRAWDPVIGPWAD